VTRAATVLFPPQSIGDPAAMATTFFNAAAICTPTTSAFV
jgi:hypothetical protein